MVEEGHEGGGGDRDDHSRLLRPEAGQVVSERHEGGGGDDRSRESDVKVVAVENVAPGRWRRVAELWG